MTDIYRRITLPSGWIELLHVCPDPATYNLDVHVAAVARTSTAAEHAGARTLAQDEKLIRFLIKNRHTSPFEFVQFQFRIKAPVFVWLQWLRHRVWSFNMESRRYREAETDDCLVFAPDQWRYQATTNKQASFGQLPVETGDELTQACQQHVEASFALYRRLLVSGVAREQARVVLPLSLNYVAVASIDAHNLIGFIKLRSQPEAQREIAYFSDAMRDEYLAKLMPMTYAALTEK